MEYEIIIRPKPIVEFESVEELRRHIERLREQQSQEPNIKHNPKELLALTALLEREERLRKVKAAIDRQRAELRAESIPSDQLLELLQAHKPDPPLQ